MREVLAIVLVACSLSCANRITPQAPQAAPSPATGPGGAASRPTSAAPAAAWQGVYAMPSEVAGFAGEVLLLDEEFGRHSYAMQTYSDMVSTDDIPQDKLSGSYLTEGEVLYLPHAIRYMRDGKPRLLAGIDRYTRVRINGRDVLLRDDALRAYRQENKLYDYGILIKVSDEGGLVDLSKVERPSIKVLYADPSKPWADPFVHGPNPR